MQNLLYDLSSTIFNLEYPVKSKIYGNLLQDLPNISFTLNFTCNNQTDTIKLVKHNANLRIDIGQQLYSILIVKGKVSIVKWESLEYTDFVGIEKENLIEWLR